MGFIFSLGFLVCAFVHEFTLQFKLLLSDTSVSKLCMFHIEILMEEIFNSLAQD